MAVNETTLSNQVGALNQSAADSPNVLFFIPDISGFTKFINETEISHSQHIISELLELLVDSNSLGLTVSEFEGDAVFFYRFGSVPSLNDFTEQARRMFVNFHSHIRRYETHRLCQCGACKTAHNLTLKIIAHYGEAASMKVKDHSKLIGTGVITVHRLLKNSVNGSEYMLLTNSLLGSVENKNGEIAEFNAGSDNYDEIGNIEYKFMSLEKFKSEIKDEEPEEFRIDNPVKVFEYTKTIDMAYEEVYAIVIDFSHRTKWVHGVKEIKLFDKKLNQAGTRHLCVMEKGSDNDIITASPKVTENTIEFWEIDRKKIGGCHFISEKISARQSKFTVEFYLKNNFLLKAMFKIMMAKKIEAALTTSADNLKEYCESSKN